MTLPFILLTSKLTYHFKLSYDRVRWRQVFQEVVLSLSPGFASKFTSEDFGFPSLRARWPLSFNH